MNITLYKTTSENNRLDKVLTDGISMSGNLRDESNVINPSILISAGNITNYNYCYIEEFNRYYFINEITSVRTGLWRIDLHVDVLYTYKEAIRNLSAIIDKQEGRANTTELYNDGSFRVKEDNFIETYNFTSGFNDSGEFILLTAGAISTP